jgi:thioredoxin reductase
MNFSRVLLQQFKMASRITTAKSPVDVLVIGAGPAGLACTISVSRLLHTAICFSSGEYRNAKSKHMHGIPTWEHRDAADFRAAARKDILANYDTASFEDVRITSLEKKEREGGGTLFRAVDETGKEWWGRKVALATGIKDLMPDIEGYEDCWADSM